MHQHGAQGGGDETGADQCQYHCPLNQFTGEMGERACASDNDAEHTGSGNGGCQRQAMPNHPRGVERAAANARPGDVVMLSPACASFDQFKDFEARGNAFKAAVAALA